MRFEDIAEGTELPELVFPVTASAIAVGAIATNDYETVHHDKAAAEATGVPNIFMNILTTNGLVQRFVESWAGGPGAPLRELKIKLGAPNYPGDSMTLSGSVTDKRDSDRSVEVTLKGKNGFGNHVTGTVRVCLA